MPDSPSFLIEPTKSNGRKSCSDFNILSPQLKEPFKKGWKREIVYRAIVGNEKRNMCDIYYIAPDGKKLRSRREVSDHLTQTSSSFSLENFTYCKEPIGMDVKHEILRFARAKIRRDVESSKNTLPKKNVAVRAHREKVLRRSHPKDKDDVPAITRKQTTSKPTPLVDKDKISSKINHTIHRNTRASARKASLNKMKFQAQPPKRKANYTSNCKSDSDCMSSPSDIEELESPSGEEKVESRVQPSPTLTPELPEPLPVTLPLTSPLILPLGTSRVLSDSPTVRINPSNLSSSSTPLRESEPISPKVSLLPATNRSVVTDSSSVTSSSPDAATSFSSMKFQANAKSIPCSTPDRRIISSENEGFAIPRCLSVYQNQISLTPFGTVNRKRSYWTSIGQAIIDEGLQKAMPSRAPQSNTPITENPVRLTRKKSLPKKFQNVPKPPSPKASAVLTCKDYFALRKQLRHQQQLNQSSVTGASN